MARMIHLQLEHPEDADSLAETLRLHGLAAGSLRPLLGQPQVTVRKPLFRRTTMFVSDVESIVRRWLESEAPDLHGVTARAGLDHIEIVSPTAELVALPPHGSVAPPPPSSARM